MAGELSEVSERGGHWLDAHSWCAEQAVTAFKILAHKTRGLGLTGGQIYL